MKVAVMGTGGVGGYFGARLAANGIEVTFIARGAHLEAIPAQRAASGECQWQRTHSACPATDTPADIGPVDYVLFTTKLWDTRSAGEVILPLMGADTAVISLQNELLPNDCLGTFSGVST